MQGGGRLYIYCSFNRAKRGMAEGRTAAKVAIALLSASCCMHACCPAGAVALLLIRAGWFRIFYTRLRMGLFLLSLHVLVEGGGGRSAFSRKIGLRLRRLRGRAHLGVLTMSA